MKKIRLTIILCFVILLSSCTDNPVDIYDYGSVITNDNKLHVFLIGIDGWGAYSMPKANMPAAKYMMEQGSYTLNAENVLPTGSNPNWVSMFSGTTPAFHGFTIHGLSYENTVQPTFLPVLIDEYGFFPNIFALIKKRLPNCTVDAFYEYKMIEELIPSAVLDTSKYISDLSKNKESVTIITHYIENINREKPSFTFVQFDGADSAGHSSGYKSMAYYEKLTQIDEHIALITQAVKDAGIEDNSIFILSADHGGILYGHGTNTPQERQIPLIFYGAHIKQGLGILSEAHIYDIAPTIAAMFSVPVPFVWLGRPLSEVFDK